MIDPNFIRLAAMRDDVRRMRDGYPKGPCRTTLTDAADELDLAVDRLLRGDREPSEPGLLAPVGRAFIVAAAHTIHAGKALADWLRGGRF